MGKVANLEQIQNRVMDNLTREDFLNKVRMTKERMQGLVSESGLLTALTAVGDKEGFTCKEIYEVSERLLDLVCFDRPDGWLFYVYEYVLKKSFPDAVTIKLDKQYTKAVLVYLEILRAVFSYEREHAQFDKFMFFRFLTDREVEGLENQDEYLRFMEAFRECYVYEMMRLHQEVTPFNTLEHIAGVHYVAMHIGRQLKSLNTPVDLGIVSGAAIGHDIGKYGCKENESRRVPYLHYYYTDIWFKKHHIPNIGHVAANHSTWDLELENLPVEALILIYADFRVKNMTDKYGTRMHIYPLDKSFEVILDKLDNVDDAKRNRYIKVYTKLKDFEDYMCNLGVNTDFTTDQVVPVVHRDYSVIYGEDVVEELKYMAVKHNIALMHKLSGATSFAGIIESARSESNRENIRAYLNVLEEYNTYLTQSQKLYTMSFLYEQLSHNQGDVRRQAAELLGMFIVGYDEEYRKEIPQDAKYIQEEVTSLSLWEKYLGQIITPDHRNTDQQRDWIWDTLKAVVKSVFCNCGEKYIHDYMSVFVRFYRENGRGMVMLLDSLPFVPVEKCLDLEIRILMDYVFGSLLSSDIEVRVGCMLSLEHFVSVLDTGHVSLERIKTYMENSVDVQEDIYVNFIKYKIVKALDFDMKTESAYEDKIQIRKERLSDIFLDNLKAATPWIVKTVSIDFMLFHVGHVDDMVIFHMATHLSNLIKVSAKATVRNNAGLALLKVAPFLTTDQMNEIAIELVKGLELEGLEFSKYIPRYLGRLALLLPPKELDELLWDLKNLYRSSPGKVSRLVLNTLGVMVEYYPEYQKRFNEPEKECTARLRRILSRILKGLSNYDGEIRQEAFLVLGRKIFGSRILSLEEKNHIFVCVSKKMLTLITEKEIDDVFFFYNSASLNYIYRFMNDYIFVYNKLGCEQRDKIAFFPGTFDPFSRSHKAIAVAIRNLGYDVYLAVDEFSWSKRTQPQMVRRQIMNMSIADEFHIYLFPNDIPVNISNPQDLKRLKDIFSGKKVSIAVGSDVVENASAYKNPVCENSIHTFDHVVFKRASHNKYEAAHMERLSQAILGNVVELSLPVYLEDISSTQIRENIDANRDISNLIDPMAQKFIYEKSLYLREPQYKSMIQAKPIKVEVVDKATKETADYLRHHIFMYKDLYDNIVHAVESKDIKILLIREGEENGKVIGFTMFHKIGSADLYKEFKSTYVAEYVRERTSGRIIIIDGIYSTPGVIDNIIHILFTETLAHVLKQDFTYALYHNTLTYINRDAIEEVLLLQGFEQLQGHDLDETHSIFAVDMKFPVSIMLDAETFIKEPLNKNPAVLVAVRESRKRLQRALVNMNPGRLLLSFDIDMIHNAIINKICETNDVPAEVLPKRTLGEYMCVPFGSLLKGRIVPNTVTKSLHTDKVFNQDITSFTIREYPFYSPLETQIKTIKSFDRKVLLVDDLLHKGNRLKVVAPLLKKENIDVVKIIVGIMSSRGKDIIDVQGGEVECAYFIPNLKLWFNENLLYPFFGGDSVSYGEEPNLNIIPSINMILPYVEPNFMRHVPYDAFLELSKVCLENSKHILETLEHEYQTIFQKNLTISRLGEIVNSPRCPDRGIDITYDWDIEPSRYVENDMNILKRLASKRGGL